MKEAFAWKDYNLEQKVAELKAMNQVLRKF